jgi:eukaryotic-like serine/threonine-protein kinase
VLYGSLESGRGEIYVTSFPKADGKWQVSTDGGQWARWSRDGREIYYLAVDNQLMVAEVNGTGNTIKVGSVRPLFPMRSTRQQRFSYDVSPESRRFFVNSLQEQSTTTPVTVVLNWAPAQ